LYPLPVQLSSILSGDQKASLAKEYEFRYGLLTGGRNFFHPARAWDLRSDITQRLRIHRNGINLCSITRFKANRIRCNPTNPLGPGSRGLSQALARIELAEGNVAVGCTLTRQALAMRPPDEPDTGWRHAETQGVYGECMAKLGQIGTARYQLQAALAALERVRGADHWMTRSVRTALLALRKA
jgi:hypothetical protein